MSLILSYLPAILFSVFRLSCLQLQPGCPHFNHTLRFYMHHSYDLQLPSICEDPFVQLLASCVRIYQKVRSKKVQTTYKLVRDANTVVKTCEKRKMAFWRMDNSTGSESLSQVTIDVNMFTCPLTKMDLTFADGKVNLELEDFYITEGTNKTNVAVLQNSTIINNICLMNLLKYNFSKGEFVEAL